MNDSVKVDKDHYDFDVNKLHRFIKERNKVDRIELDIHIVDVHRIDIVDSDSELELDSKLRSDLRSKSSLDLKSRSEVGGGKFNTFF